MREIKFRAYWFKEKAMTTDFDLDEYANDQDGTYGDGIYPNLYHVEQKNATIIQYTGLKDKNGKEIYEGDILAMPEISKEVYWIVEWKALGGFMHDGDDMPVGFTIKSNIPQHIHPDVIRLEVIGNIYENPELVGKNK